MADQSHVVPVFEAGLVILTTFFLFVFLGGAFLLTLGTEPTLVLGELVILLVPLSYLLFKRINIKNYIKISFNPKSIAIGISAGAALILLNVAVSSLLTSIFGVSQAVEESNTLLINTSQTPLGLILVATSLALAGICEEFAFRGFLQNALTRRFSFLPAAIVSALVFGLFHFDPEFVYIIASFVGGFALGYIYHRWNYTTAATAHASMNLMVLALLLFGI
ncbi:MAG: CPBP family intramembrane metalloprotease [Candidatus Bathyarchaeota archaeon]|nr:CPBP family intramembrane metalloprotease [Candidatus Bathyarchaeota archaeon]